jgi:dTDP-glucose pyrophosphorylase/CBS domain-containing protein
MANLTYLLVSPNTTIQQAIECIDHNAYGIVLVTDQERRLLGTVTDGDIRRGILKQISLDTPVSVLLTQPRNPRYRVPTSAPADTSVARLVELMRTRKVHQVPLLDHDGRVVDLITTKELVAAAEVPVTAIIMAGGQGSRLRPLTEDTPKPMLPVGDRPIMEHLLEGLKASGIRQVTVTTHYKPEAIENYFGDGEDFGVQINYVSEAQPMGTGGSLALMETPDRPFLVINGDIMTDLDFHAMLEFHQDHSAVMTIGVRPYDVQIPFGVIEAEGVEVKKLAEKPSLSLLVNAGIYLIEPTVYGYLPKSPTFDMTDVIQRLLTENQRVVSYPIEGYWLDVGRHEDYAQAQARANLTVRDAK